jgi:hypothetical protein
MVPPNAQALLTLGHRFVAHAESESLGGAEASALQDVVAMSGQYNWLAVRAADAGLQFDPGPKDTDGTYAVAPFKAFLDDLLTGLVDDGVTYTAGLFMEDHVLKEGRWVPTGGQLFRLLANGAPLVQEASIAGVAYDVEILISVAVNP